jgi:hypothetical protein
MSKDKMSKIEKRQNIERQNVERQNVEITKRSKFSGNFAVAVGDRKRKKKNCRKQKKEKLHEIQFCIFTVVKTFYKLVKKRKKEDLT